MRRTKKWVIGVLMLVTIGIAGAYAQTRQPIRSTGKYKVDIPADSPYQMVDPWAEIPNGPAWGAAMTAALIE